MRILLIEDDQALAKAMMTFLKTKGFTLELVSSLQEAQTRLSTAEWGAVLLDLHLPDGDGLSLLPVVRQQSMDASVIILTARDQTSDRIKGLDAGADDYLVKPFDPEELLARLRAIERRKSGAASAVLNLGDLSIDMARNIVSVKGVQVDLTAKEWALLRMMAARPDRVHSKESLSGALYRFSDDVESNTLEVFISHLRRKLGKDCIQTLRGLGYRLSSEVA